MELALRQVGYCYENGLGVKQNFEMAMAYYNKAIEAGSIKGWFYYLKPFKMKKKAFNSLGNLMERLGNYEKAINYYSNGDIQGDYIGNFFFLKKIHH